MTLSNQVIKQRKDNMDMCTVMLVGKADFT